MNSKQLKVEDFEENPLHIVDENGNHDCSEEELKIWREI